MREDNISYWGVIRLLMDGVSKWRRTRDIAGTVMMIHESGYWYWENTDCVTLRKGELDRRCYEKNFNAFEFIFISLLASINSWMVRRYGANND